MPEQVAAPAAARQEEGGSSVWRSVLNGVLIFFAINTLSKQFFSQPSASVNTAPPFDPAAPAAHTDRDVYSLVPENIYPIWPQGTPLDISIYLHESLELPSLSSLAASQKKVFDEKEFVLGAPEKQRVVSTTVNFSKHVQNNGTLWAHIFVAQSGAIADPWNPKYDATKAFRQVKLLTRYMPKRKVIKTKKLIGGTEDDAEDVPEVPTTDIHGNPLITSYWHSNLTLDVVGGTGTLNYKQTPPPLRQHIRLTGQRDQTGKNDWYYPIVFVNDFWLLKEHMVELNNTVEALPLHIHLNPSVFWKFQIYASLDEAFKQASNPQKSGIANAGSTGAELEEVKRVLVDTNMYLLATTITVSLLHTVFEMLAFKNDISHWKNKKDNVGVSFRTILANVFMQLVIFLYLIDNSDGTSYMILFGQGMGIVLEAWKITKTVDVKVRPAPGSLFGYKITFEDKHKLSDLEKETKEYDEIAFSYLYKIAIPLLLAYAGYSLMYETHKSWYSFVITTLVGSVYAYGFLMMVPSLYINYRLKSVAHMPRKAMMYKFLNTFIDDLFAFTIKMPTLHRLATLRDDVIFFVYLWQAYHYKVDKNRINEFGQGGEEDEPKPAKPVADEKKELTEAPASEAIAVDKKPVQATGTEPRVTRASKRK